MKPVSRLRPCQRDVNAIIDLSYQDAGSFASGTVSLTISHLSELQTFRSALARPLRKTTKSSGWNATTKSLSSRRIDTRFVGPIGKDFVSRPSSHAWRTHSQTVALPAWIMHAVRTDRKKLAQIENEHPDSNIGTHFRV
jgi:hypothetical protein